MPAQLTPEDLAKLHDRQIANIVQKIAAGKTPTARESAMLAQAGVGSAAAAPSGFCKTWDQLAERLGVSLRALKDWRKRDDLKDALPKPRADGRHDVAAWASLMVEHGLARADETAPLSGKSDGTTDLLPIQTDSVFQPKTIRDWKGRLEELKCQRLEQKIRVEAGELVITADIEVALGQMLVAFRASLDHLPPSAARWVRGLTDFHAIVERLQAECDALLHGLYRGDYLAEILPGIVAAQPAPTGIDAVAWSAALTAAVSNALRAIGRLALPADNPAEPPPVTREVTAVTPIVTPPRKKKRPSKAKKPRDDEATAHAQLEPTLAERATKARARRKR